MTQEEFDYMKFSKGMKAKHIKYGDGDIIGVDLDERLINLSLPEFIEDNWVRCENVELMEDRP